MTIQSDEGGAHTLFQEGVDKSDEGVKGQNISMLLDMVRMNWWNWDFGVMSLGASPQILTKSWFKYFIATLKLGKQIKLFVHESFAGTVRLKICNFALKMFPLSLQIRSINISETQC